ncbi:barstar family protein [Sorangium sp. So ce117]|uniref:barstar family protein n=1 Tax=Sorangium sp. So ce117 TaxID=3133277 RepID=UPI003F5EA6C5
MDLTHFQGSAERDIHIFRDGVRLEDVEAALRQVARDLAYHFIALRGDRMTNEAEALTEIARAFELPHHDDPGYRRNWDGTADHIMNMRWRHRPQSPSQFQCGHLVLYCEPAHLIAGDALSFATLLDLLGTRPESSEGREVPLHIAIGPMSFRHEFFATLLKVERHFCHDCQLLGRAEADEQDLRVEARD